MSLTARRCPQGLTVRLHYTADPSYTPQLVKHLRAHADSEASWRKDMEIDYEAKAGTPLYATYIRELNSTPAFDVSDPNAWTIYMGLDPHMRTPHAMVWEAFSQYGERAVCGEFWPTSGDYAVKDYAEAIALFESDSKCKPMPFQWSNGKKLVVYDRIMDTHGEAANSDEGTDYFEAYSGYKSNGRRLIFSKAHKGEQILAVAVDRIRKALKSKVLVDGEPYPELAIFEECYETHREFANVRFPEGEVERPSQERQLTYRKHCLDCLHYIETAEACYRLPRSLSGKPLAEPARLYPNIAY